MIRCIGMKTMITSAPFNGVPGVGPLKRCMSEGGIST